VLLDRAEAVCLGIFDRRPLPLTLDTTRSGIPFCYQGSTNAVVFGQNRMESHALREGTVVGSR
jgi:hypothetical protein